MVVIRLSKGGEEEEEGLEKVHVLSLIDPSHCGRDISIRVTARGAPYELPYLPLDAFPLPCIVSLPCEQWGLMSHSSAQAPGNIDGNTNYHLARRAV